ncbi:hypothetical protein AB6A40_005773 [Gnathostoma spinigerum]|uniref:Uncharacterized protein n=1 Tax=Gnathostoma spinigerum TaxID=75299 RepID=A0ABD6EGF1_9BILA
MTGSRQSACSSSFTVPRLIATTDLSYLLLRKYEGIYYEWKTLQYHYWLDERRTSKELLFYYSTTYTE